MNEFSVPVCLLLFHCVYVNESTEWKNGVSENSVISLLPILIITKTIEIDNDFSVSKTYKVVRIII